MLNTPVQVPNQIWLVPNVLANGMHMTHILGFTQKAAVTKTWKRFNTISKIHGGETSDAEAWYGQVAADQPLWPGNSWCLG